MPDRKLRGGKNRLAEIEKPRGFDRGLGISEIVGATDYTGDLMYLVRWQNCDELDLLSASEVDEKSPQDVISFYEKRSAFNKRVKQRTRPNIPIIVKEVVAAITKPEPANEEEAGESKCAAATNVSAMETDDVPEEPIQAAASTD